MRWTSRGPVILLVLESDEKRGGQGERDKQVKRRRCELRTGGVGDLSILRKCLPKNLCEDEGREQCKRRKMEERGKRAQRITDGICGS